MGLKQKWEKSKTKYCEIDDFYIIEEIQQNRNQEFWNNFSNNDLLLISVICDWKLQKYEDEIHSNQKPTDLKIIK